ncbi:MAG: GTPase ObgE [Anaerolineales bacterium]|nr:GTPase ObgE [Anaerolineales bacterium]
MFYDQAKIKVRSGDGGDGMISFRREKYIPLGGPSGGDGGRGGDVILVVNPKLNSLVAFHRHAQFEAENGNHGGSSNKTGASGESLIIEVPPGTVVKDADNEDIIADLTGPEQQAVIVEGGRGGRGNARFATSTNQAPRVAERGEPGEERWINLELKLIADVGIIGVPNAGKSTLLSAVSAARPKIADYPFTTLAPNLGVASLDDFRSLILADIPGLIEGAHQGAGLGHDFLRHIERTRVLIHLLNGAAENPLDDWAKIDEELALYNPQLAQRPQIVVLNKMDLEEASILWWPEIKKIAKQRNLEAMAISAVTGQGVRALLNRVWRILEELPDATEVSEEPIIRFTEEDSFTIEREITEKGPAWRIRGKNIERIAAMTYWEFSEAVTRFQHILERMGIVSAMENAGVKPGDTVLIGDQELTWGE